MNTRPRLIQGHVIDRLRDLPEKSVQTMVTSPPYWGLRAYTGEQNQIWGGDDECEHRWGEDIVTEGMKGSVGSDTNPYGYKLAIKGNENYKRVPDTKSAFCQQCGAWFGGLGLEPTPDLFLRNMVLVMREVRRVLRDDGTVWLNLGDTYARSGGGTWGDNVDETDEKDWAGLHRNTGAAEAVWTRKLPPGLPEKNLVGIPWRVAFALQEDGWVLRSDIIWNKPNPMPESIRDRPTKSHDYIFLLSKNKRYYYNADAVREPLATALHAPGNVKFDHRITRGGREANRNEAVWGNPLGRNARSVWTFNTQPYPGAHFATFPEELPERCIKAATALKACGICGTPWKPLVVKEAVNERSHKLHKGKTRDVVDSARGTAERGGLSPETEAGTHNPEVRVPGFSRTGTQFEWNVKNVGWESGCMHDNDEGLCVVLDPFAGSGTTCSVAARLGRASIGIELSDEYLKLAKERTNTSSHSLYKFDLDNPQATLDQDWE